MVKDVADEGYGQDTADWESDVEKVVDFGRDCGRMENVCILRADGCHEEIVTEHLDDCNRKSLSVRYDELISSAFAHH